MMLRVFLRVSSAVTAVAIALVVILCIEGDQSSFPGGTSASFTVSVGQAPVAKEDLAMSLDGVARESHATFMKQSVTDVNGVRSNDLVVFGGREYSGGSEVEWFDPALRGEYVSAADIGARPLDGYYTATACDSECRHNLSEWAATNEVTLGWETERSLMSTVVGGLTGSGQGIALMSMLLLVIALTLAWFVSQGETRTIRLAGGVPAWRIQFDSDYQMFSLFGVGIAAGAFVSVVGVGLTRGVSAARLFAKPYGLTLIVCFSVFFLVATLISWLARPKASHVASRGVPLAAIRRASTTVRVGALIVSVVAVPFVVTVSQTAANAMQEADRWENAGQAVKTAMSNIPDDKAAIEARQSDWDGFFTDISASSTAAVSMALDEFVYFDPEELGSYDHILLTDQAFLSMMGFDNPQDAPRGVFSPVSDDEISPLLRERLDAQLPIFLREENAASEVYSYYEYSGSESLPAVGQQVGNGLGLTAAHPLVVLVNDPFLSFNTDMNLATMTNGNALFRDPALLGRLLDQYDLRSFVNSIDSAADLSLQAAQVFRSQAVMSAIGLALMITTLCVGLLLSGRIWATHHSPQIFALHTHGESFFSIQKWTALRAALLAVAVVVATGIVFSFASPNPATDGLIALAALLPTYIIAHCLTHAYAGREVFFARLHRKG